MGSDRGVCDEAEYGGEDKPAPKTLQSVKGILLEKRAYELPSYTPYTAVLQIIKQHQPSWKQHVDKCLDDSSAAMTRQLVPLVDIHFRIFPKLAPRMRTFVSQLVKEKQANTRMKLQELLDMESGFPITKNDHYFTSCEAAFLQQLTAAFKNAYHYASIHADDLSALEVMATTLAYYKVASKRFVDYSLLVMRACLQQALADDFQAYIRREMHKIAGYDEGCDLRMRQHWSWSKPVLSLLEEEPAAALRRKHLEAREEKLVALQNLLSDAGGWQLSLPE